MESERRSRGPLTNPSSSSSASSSGVLQESASSNPGQVADPERVRTRRGTTGNWMRSEESPRIIVRFKLFADREEKDGGSAFAMR